MSNTNSETKTSKYRLFTFSKIIDDQFFNCEKHCDRKNYEIELNEEWNTFWIKNGNDIVLESWICKYKYYIDTDILIKSETICESETSIESIQENTNQDWTDLWNQHYENLYKIVYEQFSLNFYIVDRMYQLQIKSFFQSDNISSYSNFDELQQIEALGLPTGFGINKQWKNKKSTTIELEDEWIESEDELEELYFEEIDDEVSILDKNIENMDISNNESELMVEKAGVNQKKKKRNRNLKKIPAYILEDKALYKYWRKRFSLFSRFDEGIKLDRESWFSVTPEKIAEQLASRLKTDVIVDGFCGSGGNAIQFAKTCQKVIAIDIDPTKIACARHNAKIYGVENKIDFIIGDFLKICKYIKADIVFLSPPWGGPKYKNNSIYDIEKNLLPIAASELINICRNISDNIAIYLPRNSNVNQIIQIAGVGNQTEIEKSFLDTRLVAITAFYGGLVGRNKK